VVRGGFGVFTNTYDENEQALSLGMPPLRYQIANTYTVAGFRATGQPNEDTFFPALLGSPPVFPLSRLNGFGVLNSIRDPYSMVRIPGEGDHDSEVIPIRIPKLI